MPLVPLLGDALQRLRSFGRLTGAVSRAGTSSARDSRRSVSVADDDIWATRIRQALDDDRFELFAQPIVDLATSRVVWSELLLRLRTRYGRLIPPAAFLPTAERRELIAEIDEWVVGQAVRLAAGGQPVTANLSAVSAGDPAVLEVIEREVRRARPDPGKLLFEITETTILHDLEWGRHFVARLNALGCPVALDDFGTGFATFPNLKHLPVQHLKIDAEFVRDLSRDQADRTVVSAIVALAGGFGQQTIAEGVEQAETAEVLRNLGVTFAQGSLFGAPVPLAASPSEVPGVRRAGAPSFIPASNSSTP